MTDSRFLFCVFVLTVIFLNVHTIHGYYYDKGNRRILFDSFMLSIFFNCIFIKGPVQTLTKCPGYYCGRHQIPGILFSNIFISMVTLKLELYFYLLKLKMAPVYGALAVHVQEVHGSTVPGHAQIAAVPRLFMIGCIFASW